MVEAAPVLTGAGAALFWPIERASLVSASDRNRQSCDARHTGCYALVLNPLSARWRNGDAEAGNRPRILVQVQAGPPIFFLRDEKGRPMMSRAVVRTTVCNRAGQETEGES